MVKLLRSEICTVKTLNYSSTFKNLRSVPFNCTVAPCLNTRAHNVKVPIKKCAWWAQLLLSWNNSSPCTFEFPNMFFPVSAVLDMSFCWEDISYPNANGLILVWTLETLVFPLSALFLILVLFLYRAERCTNHVLGCMGDRHLQDSRSEARFCTEPSRWLWARLELKVRNWFHARVPQSFAVLNSEIHWIIPALIDSRLWNKQAGKVHESRGPA